MFFVYAHSSNCNRFSVSGKQNVTIRPTAKTQMVLGTNGSGKSSMLSILFSVLPPADPKDFDNPGKWEVHVLHHGRTYELSATYLEKPAYNFIVDGEELNRGHTITVQLELTKEHFNMTRELSDLMMGKINFTDMSPQARRDWIAKLSTVDFAYAFKELARYKKGRTASSNVVDFLNGRYNEESIKLLNPDDLTTMRSKVAELHDTLDQLMREPRCMEPDISEGELHTKFTSTLQQIDTFAGMEYPLIALPDEEALEKQLHVITSEVSELTGELRVRSERLSKADAQYERVKSMMSVNPKELIPERDALQASLEAIPAKRIDIPDELLIAAPEAIQKLKNAIVDLPAEYIPQVEVNRISKETFQLRHRSDKVKGVLKEIHLEIDHIKACTEVTCPGCSYTFKPGVTEGRLESLAERAGKGSEVLKEYSQQADDAEDGFLKVQSDMEAFSVLEQIRDQYRATNQGLFLYLEQMGGLSKGRGIQQHLSIYEVEAARQTKRLDIRERLQSLNLAIDQYTREAGDFVSIEEEYRDATSAYNAVHKALQSAKVACAKLQLAITDGVQWDDTYSVAERSYVSLREDIITYCHHEGDRLLEDIIKKTRTTLAINEVALAENDMVETLVKDLQVQLDKAKVQLTAYNALVDAMCPKSGLIAEQLAAQLGSMIGGMNSMIQRIWGYPLSIELGDITETDLDYKFPINCDGILRKDISLGSDSMKEMINRAFVLIAYYCLDLADYPLYLDEPGRTFDAVHARNLIPMIKDLVDSNRFSQIFLISHDADTQIAFPNSETIIIDDRNIRYPHSYNTHVELN